MNLSKCLGFKNLFILLQGFYVSKESIRKLMEIIEDKRGGRYSLILKKMKMS
jgi:hypothetical protein